MFKMIFGGGTFDDIFGELGLASMVQDAKEELTEEEAKQKFEKEQSEKKEKLVEELLKKLDAHITGKDKLFKNQEADVLEKLDAPGGPALLNYVAYIYVQEAKKYLGRYLGIEGFFAEIEEKGHSFKQAFSLITSLVKLQAAQNKLEQVGEKDENLSNELMTQGLSMIWKFGLLEIEKTVRDVCEVILKIQDKKLKKQRAAALKDLGEFYKKEIKSARKRGIELTSPFERAFKEDNFVEKKDGSFLVETNSKTPRK